MCSTEARLFGAEKAKEIGLIDKMGTLYTTIATMKRDLKDFNVKVFCRELYIQPTDVS